MPYAVVMLLILFLWCSGYMSPEYALEGLFSVKSDVFSFGVIVLEIVSGKRNTGFYQSQQGMNLLTYVSTKTSHNNKKTIFWVEFVSLMSENGYLRHGDCGKKRRHWIWWIWRCSNPATDVKFWSASLLGLYACKKILVIGQTCQMYFSCSVVKTRLFQILKNQHLSRKSGFLLNLLLLLVSRTHAPSMTYRLLQKKAGKLCSWLFTPTFVTITVSK